MRTALALVLVLLLAPFWQAFAGLDPALDAALAAAMKATAVPGMGVAVIHNNKLAGIAVRGIREMGHAHPVQADDLWQIGSVTKPMTATLILRLVEEKRLALDAPLSATDPELAKAALPVYRSITLHQMLAHTAGLPHDYHDVEKVMDSFRPGMTLPAERAAYLKLALTDAPVSPPGKEYHYSNTGFILAAAIAEHATGLSYEELMQREIFAPLGMRHTRIGLPPPGGNHGHMNGKPARATDELPPAMNPAGGVSLSLGDLSKFCIDQLDRAKGHGKLLTTADYKLMQSPDPVSGNGLDWGTVKTGRKWQGPILEHGGSDEAWRSVVLLFPESGNALIVNANADKGMGGNPADQSVVQALLPLVAKRVNAPAAK